MPYIDPKITMGYESIRTMREMMSGTAVLDALKDAIEEVRSSAPEDHDILIVAHNILVTEVRFIYPHSFFFQGLNSDGHRTVVVVHFSQLVAQIISRKKEGDKRVVTGFCPNHPDSQDHQNNEDA